jgi:hypothetical protein
MPVMALSESSTTQIVALLALLQHIATIGPSRTLRHFGAKAMSEAKPPCFFGRK